VLDETLQETEKPRDRSLLATAVRRTTVLNKHSQKQEQLFLTNTIFLTRKLLVWLLDILQLTGWDWQANTPLEIEVLYSTVWGQVRTAPICHHCRVGKTSDCQQVKSPGMTSCTRVWPPLLWIGTSIQCEVLCTDATIAFNVRRKDDTIAAGKKIHRRTDGLTPLLQKRDQRTYGLASLLQKRGQVTGKLAPGSIYYQLEVAWRKAT
jgi:hypothetical protein